MKNRTLHFVFAIVCLTAGLYQVVYRQDVPEACIYFLAGLSFVCNILASEPRLLPFKKGLTIATWVLLVFAGLLFMYQLQFNHL